MNFKKMRIGVALLFTLAITGCGEEQFPVKTEPSDSTLQQTETFSDAASTLQTESVMNEKNEPDTTPPTILAPERRTVAFGDSIRYREGVTVSDDSGEEIELHIESDEVNLNRAGEYSVLYWAEDSAGNKSQLQCTVIVEPPIEATEEDVKALAEDILSQLAISQASQKEQLYSIYRWCHDNIRYVGDAPRTTLLQGAYEGMKYRLGDCFTIFATAKYLMDYLEIENFSVSRASENATHFWSLVHLDTGWYHMDCTPQPGGFECFLCTDERVREYGTIVRKNPDYYTFDETDAPARATKMPEE